MKEPLVIEIKGNSLDDGPGIRTVVFLKGCPLSCIWCHNPESKSPEAELSWARDDCLGCGSCIKACPNSALSPENSFFIDRDKCARCFSCAGVCPSKALTRVGKKMSIDEIVAKASVDSLFYQISGGGVTLSGGEATLFTEWVGELARRLKDEGISVLVETCGMFSHERVRGQLLPYVDDVYYDLKLFNRDLHKKYCGVYNDAILENFRLLLADSAELGFRLLPRTPLIPGITDTDENLSAIAGFLAELGVTKTELLPYNPTWYSKNDKLGLTLASELESAGRWQDRDKLEHCKQIYRDKNISC